tara:strand:- start:130 stop:288 length:159 start_codon:yes stop_codon:yes gene_type:complete
VLASNDLLTVTMTFARLAELYADCALGKAGAVNSYVAARAAAEKWNAGSETR